MPNVPYVTAAEFVAHPTYLDLDDLRSGITDPDAQTAELTNVLLMASQWADRECHQPLGAHTVVQHSRVRCDRDGNLQLFADDWPVLSVKAVSIGRTPAAQTAASAVSGAWVQAERLVLLPAGSLATTASPGLFVTWAYEAGYAATLLADDGDSGTSTLTVADPTGILPGTSYRLWEPGAEEIVTVAATYVPPEATTPPTPTPIPLATPTAFAHTAGAGWSGMPADMKLAVINYAVSTLMRPDTADEDAYPDTPMASGTRQNDPRKDGSGLVLEAVRILAAYARRI